MPYLSRHPAARLSIWVLFSLFSLFTMLSTPLHALASEPGAQSAPEKVTIQSTTLGRETSFYVFSPSDTSGTKRYPVLYLLHGENGTYEDWYAKTQLASLLANANMIVVTPDGGKKGWYLDSPLVKDSKYESFISSELPQYIDSHYSTVAARVGRAISGFAMGGHGALSLAARHPDVFGSVSSLAAITDIARLPDNKDLAKLLGAYAKSKDAWIGSSALRMAAAGRFPADLPVYLACGLDDPMLQQNRDMQDALRMTGIASSYVEHPGKGDWKFCAARLEEILLFHAKQFRKGQALPKAPQADLISFASTALKGETKFYVLKPGGFSTAKRYPVLYLLHGAWGSYVDWYKNTSLTSYLADKDMLVVLPDGSNMPAYIDSPVLPTSQYETFITKELVAYIDSNYPTIAEAGARGISGLSMGGHGAITLAMKHPDIYASASSLSGIVDINRHWTDWEIDKKLGKQKANPDIWVANSALQRTLDRLVPKGLAIFTSCGVDDFAYPENRDFHQALTLRGIPHSFVAHPGAHTWEYWDGHIEEHLLFHATSFKATVDTARSTDPAAAPAK